MGAKRVIYARLMVEITDMDAFNRTGDMFKLPPTESEEPLLIPWSDDEVVVNALTLASAAGSFGFVLRSANALPPELISETSRSGDQGWVRQSD